MELPLKRLEKNKYLLSALIDAKPKLRKAILSNSENDLIQTICEIVYNTIKGNCEIDPKICEHLKKYKKSLRILSCHKQPLQTKRKILLQQGGGFLPALIGSVIAALLAR